MAEYRVTGPDGQTYKVTGPDGASDERVLSQVHAYTNPQPKQKAIEAPAAAPQPEGTATDFIAGNLNKGVAMALGAPIDITQTIYNLGKAGVGTASGRPQDFPIVEGTPGGSQWFEDRMRGAGMIQPGAEPSSKMGEYGARALQFVPGAMTPMSRFQPGRIPSPPPLQPGQILNRYTGQTLTPHPGGTAPFPSQSPPFSVARATQPFKDVGAYAAPRAAAGATSGFSAQAATDIGGPEYGPIGAMAPGAFARAPGAGERASAERRSERFGKAKDLGIPVPPREMKPDKTQQKVQDATSRQMKIPEGTEIEPQMLANYRAAHYKEGYDSLIKDPALAQGIMPDSRFTQTITELGKETREAQRAFPETFKNTQGVMKLLSDYVQGNPMPPKVALRAIKKLRADAGINLASDKPEQVSLGHAQRKIAVALEDLIEANLPPGSESIERFRQARTAIAQSHDIESSLDPVTRKLDPTKLSALQTEGKPLSGELGKIAEVTGQFPGATKPQKKSDEMFSRRMSPTAMIHPAASAAHYATRWHDPITTSGPYQALFVDPATKLRPEQEQALRLLLTIEAGQQGQIARPPEQ